LSAVRNHEVFGKMNDVECLKPTVNVVKTVSGMYKTVLTITLYIIRQLFCVIYRCFKCHIHNEPR